MGPFFGEASSASFLGHGVRLHRPFLSAGPGDSAPSVCGAVGPSSSPLHPAFPVWPRSFTHVSPNTQPPRPPGSLSASPDSAPAPFRPTLPLRWVCTSSERLGSFAGKNLLTPLPWPVITIHTRSASVTLHCSVSQNPHFSDRSVLARGKKTGKFSVLGWGILQLTSPDISR